MQNSEVEELILRRRKQCLVHRYLYYVLDNPVVDDYQYDKFERELSNLVRDYPEIAAKVKYHNICPSQYLGSSLDNYPLEIVRQAESVLNYLRRSKDG